MANEFKIHNGAVVNGPVTATTYYGDGSNLTGVSGGGATPSLAQVLVEGNSAGTYSINLNNNDLENVKITTTNTLNILGLTANGTHKNLGLDNTGKVIQVGNSSNEVFHYSFSAIADNLDFYNDGLVKFGWDSPGNDLEFYMLTAPNGSGDMRSLATFNYGTQQNTFITTTNILYDLYGVGITAGSQLNVVVAAENDPTYPTYEVLVYYATTNIIVKITKTKKI